LKGARDERGETRDGGQGTGERGKKKGTSKLKIGKNKETLNFENDTMRE